MKVFSFCIYGSSPKYCEGLVRNLETIQKEFPDFKVIIYAGYDVPASYMKQYKNFTNTILKPMTITGHRLMCFRFFPIAEDDVELMLVRDADSRIGHRDTWCIQQFINDKTHTIFTIRDHPEHGTPILGGQWGIKKFSGFLMKDLYGSFLRSYTGNLDSYQVDQIFLREFIYKQFKSRFVAYVSHCIYPGEDIVPIDVPKKDKYDFCGNVIDYDSTGKEYYIYTTTGVA
jgi:hypothetical protein